MLRQGSKPVGCRILDSVLELYRQDGVFNFEILQFNSCLWICHNL